ncbi:MAG: hypothetical protein RIC30_09060 [Marinoscillum sp.]|uniref:hypothetical protein n=1 Tax=Marinoscillum sp. TaxID=2024838 RepID=UPI0032FA5C87
MKVSFLIDNALREAVVNSCIGILLKAMDIECKLDNYNFFYSPSGFDFFDRTRENIDLTLFPSYNVNRTPEQLSRAIRTNSMMVATHAEQIINSALYKEKLNTSAKSKYSKQITSHFVWGPFFAELLMTHSSIPADKIYITGNPKLQVSTRLNTSTPNLSPSKSVLIVSDFSLGDMDDERWSQFKKRYKANYNTPIHRHYYEARRKLVNWVLTASERYPNIHFKMRIHPGEDRAAYELLKGTNNISLVGDRDFIEDVLDSGLVFSYSSTSLFEVLVMDKQVFNLDLHDLPEERKGEYFELFEWVNKSQFMDILRNYDEGKVFYPSSGRKKLLEKYMYGGNQKAVLRNAIAIKDVLENRIAQYGFSDFLVHYRNLCLSLVKDKAVKAGIWFNKELGLQNYISTLANRRKEADLNNPVRLNPNKIESAYKIASGIVTESEIEILKNNLYEIRKEKDGIYIDF